METFLFSGNAYYVYLSPSFLMHIFGFIFVSPLIQRKCFCTTLYIITPSYSLDKNTYIAPSLEVLKARLDGVWSSLVYWKVFLLMEGGLELDNLQDPFQLKLSHGSMMPHQTLHTILIYNM